MIVFCYSHSNLFEQEKWVHISFREILFPNCHFWNNMLKLNNVKSNWNYFEANKKLTFMIKYINKQRKHVSMNKKMCGNQWKMFMIHFAINHFRYEVTPHRHTRKMGTMRMRSMTYLLCVINVHQNEAKYFVYILELITEETIGHQLKWMLSMETAIKYMPYYIPLSIQTIAVFVAYKYISRVLYFFHSLNHNERTE